MIYSMTGFGRSSFEVEGLVFEIEVRTVNHRHLDARVRLPKLLADREAAVKARIQERLGRGKVDMTVSPASVSSNPASLQVDPDVAAQYVLAARELAATKGVSGELDVTALLSLPGVTRFVDPELDDDALARALFDAVEAALSGVMEMRRAEGEALSSDFDSRLERVVELVEHLSARADRVQEAVREKLRKRTEQLRQDTGLLDEARLHQEIVIAADRMDVAEELSRLRSHVQQFRSIIEDLGDEPVGRRLDFLLQEMGREANTIGSKANDAPLAHDVVELKTELERIREQVQNVE